MTENISIIGYMNKIEFDYELGRAIIGNRVYPSIEDLRKAIPGVKDSGIVEVKVSLSKIIQETDFSERIAKIKARKL